jgi:hypothetical protein
VAELCFCHLFITYCRAISNGSEFVCRVRVFFIGLQDYKLPCTDQIQTELVQAGSKHDVRYTDVFVVFSAWKRHIGVIDNI